ncbi:PTS lactose/cellobiose transporter subunit IIA [Superficieibacter electus]|uniref:PTS lactose/cellobiose transporter subunit IIA n=1 Tax=Superficieibacter electus TaxID=2022662 RepID=A0A2P5GPE9_9ENTR|nr:PTS lactose/cellobiose transporter subunit IIA [Superficieibacter electus]POP45017.1 PTS lactose/cellobiose transporter subunit IIA [Superficieibacter electus]POP48404.1 PTS lactose/cellobiose transporter subunit IIA [Superficieibacter electus]
MTTATALDLEEIVLSIIVNAGEARSQSLQALSLAGEGNLVEARARLSAAELALREAHKTQTRLIEDEARGIHHPVSLLMIHAQDHLMNAITINDLVSIQIKKYA